MKVQESKMPKLKSQNGRAVDSSHVTASPRGGFDEYTFERGCAILSSDDSFTQSVVTLMGLRFTKVEKEEEKPSPSVTSEIRTRRGAAKRSREDESLLSSHSGDTSRRATGEDFEASTSDAFDRIGASIEGIASIASQLQPIFSPTELTVIAKHVSTQGKTRSECPDVFTLLVTRGSERRAEAGELFSKLCNQ